MRFRFRATDAGLDADDYSIVCGVDGRDAMGVEHALSFDRLSEAGAKEYPWDDCGIHTQFDDQSKGGYVAITRCHLSKNSLSVDLAGQLGRLEGVEGFDVELAIPDELFEQLKTGLIRIFRGTSGVLVFTEPSA